MIMLHLSKLVSLSTTFTFGNFLHRHLLFSSYSRNKTVSWPWSPRCISIVTNLGSMRFFHWTFLHWIFYRGYFYYGHFYTGHIYTGFIYSGHIYIGYFSKPFFPVDNFTLAIFTLAIFTQAIFKLAIFTMVNFKLNKLTPFNIDRICAKSLWFLCGIFKSWQYKY